MLARPSAPDQLVCASGKSVGTMADYFGEVGLPEAKALAEARKVVLRNEKALHITTVKRHDVGGRLVFTFHTSAGTAVATVGLAPVGHGWRLDSGGRCV